ncbi:MAG: pyridoxamine 5'-phosphate oxidase family protein [Puniceicoccales bacterium]|jgi:nitroimidazol reductase NimA-like FMN-containing flavoprotein (pyridoxamine 5'-phosphate oxidase superfamily)|nr:pyridoxamine 5'-phosphate oxidase family protein [Puniceicoccales bacterium]
MSTEQKQTVHDYIARTRVAFLAIDREDHTPTIRPIGSFAPVAPGAIDLFFSAPRDSEKARALRLHPRINFYFQHDGQEISAYKAVSLIGNASEVHASTEGYEQAVAALSARSPHFKARVEKGELAGTAIFRVTATEVRYSDFAQTRGIQKIQL